MTENTTCVASYSYDASTKELISYDTPNIIKTKAEYLVKNKYAAPGKVAINGGSNGGGCYLPPQYPLTILMSSLQASSSAPA